MRFFLWACLFTAAAGAEINNTTSGDAWCWGFNHDGQLGDGSNTDSNVPVPVAGNYSWTQVSVGYNHACGIQADQSAWCWGFNLYGQLGDGSNKNSNVPVPVAGNRSWIQISTGYNFTCGIQVDQSAWCWGINNNVFGGNLGDGSNIDSNVPVLVVGSHSWVQISAGLDYACGVQLDQSAWCWGSNTVNQLGADANLDWSSTPVLVAGNHSWTQVSVDGYHSCGIAADQSVWCWGRSKNAYEYIYPIRLAGEKSWIQVSASSLQTCGIQADKSAWCWEFSALPSFVAGSHSWVEISAGSNQICGIAVDHSAWCWNSNLIPVALAGSLLWLKISSGCGISYPSRSFTDTTQVSSSPSPSPIVSPPAIQYSPTATSLQSSSSSTPTAAIVAGVVGGVAAILSKLLFFFNAAESKIYHQHLRLTAVCTAGVYLFLRCRKRKEHAKGNSSPAEGKNLFSNAKADALDHNVQNNFPPTRPEKSLLSTPSTKPNQVASALLVNDPILDWVKSEPNTLKVPPERGIPQHVADFEFQWAQVKTIRPLGSGSFGKVYLAEVNHTAVALKVLIDSEQLKSISSAPQELPRMSDSNAVSRASGGSIVREVSIMASVRHPNVVQLIGFCILPPCITLEYCQKGSLYDLLRNGTTDPQIAAELSWGRRVRMAVDVAAGMLHLHTRNPPILHRDLKSPNVLVAGDWTAKVSDMGLSKLAEEATGQSIITGGAANPRWLAPEVLSGQNPSAASDVFSFGVVMWELLAWRLPWSDVAPYTIVARALEGARPAIPPWTELPGFGPAGPSDSLKDYLALMNQCWAQDSEQRPNFERVVIALNTLLTIL